MKFRKTDGLSFDDVYIVPKPTELKSRSEVNLDVAYICKHSGQLLSGFPLIVANMSCVGTIPMAKALYKHRAFVALHKFIEVDSLIDFFNTEESQYSFITIGMSDDDLDKLNLVISKTKYCNKICMDVANGYMYSFLDKIKQVRAKYPSHIIMAGNVATPEGVENIIKAGASVAKCGIAQGCFIKGTKVKTDKGYKNIEKIKIGDKVLTHTGQYKNVVQTHQRLENSYLINVNDICCTSNHEFYVIHKDDSSHVNENNIQEYAKWISAGELSEDYLLVKIT